MIYDNVHQLKAQLAAQQTDFARKKSETANSGLEFQREMQAKQMALQAQVTQTADTGDTKDSRAQAGEKFEAFLQSYISSNTKNALLS